MPVVLAETNDSTTENLIEPSVLSWIVLISAALFFFYEFMQMNVFNSVGSGMRETFGLTATELGQLSAYHAYANIIFLLIAGLLLDRFSTRMLILSTMALCVAATFLIAQAPTLEIAKLGRFLSGIGSAFCFLGTLRIATRWFPPRKMALATGVFVTIAMTGGAVSQAPMALLTEAYGWRNAMMLNGILGVVFLVIIWVFVKDCPDSQKTTYTKGRERLQEIGVLRSIKMAISNPQNFLGGIYTSLMNLPIALLGAIWGTAYLQYAIGFSLREASSITTMLFVGTIFGGPIIGWISDKILRRRLPKLVGAKLSFLLIVLILYAPFTSFWAYFALFFLLGFITSSQVISYPTIAESNPHYLTGTSTSIAAMIIIGGYAVFQPLFGMLMDKHWDGVVIDGVRIYSESAFSTPMLLFPLAFVVAFGAAWLIKETYCRAMKAE